MTDTRPRLALVGHEHGHEIMPDPATTVRERDGERRSLLDPAGYPMVATCSGCGWPIRCVSFYTDWQHVEAEPAEPIEASR
jgi:hypothetical protein